MTVPTLARWVEGVSWGFALLGVLLPAAFATAPFEPYRDEAARWAYGAAGLPARDARLTTLMLGILGGSIAGKWIVHALLARGPLAEGRAWARDLTLVGLAAWFLIDSAASVALGATFQVWMINLLPIVLIGLPLALSYRRFDRKAAAAASRSPLGTACFWTALFGASTGLAIAFGGTTPLFGTWFAGLDQALYAGAGAPEDARRFALLFFGPIGGCTFAQFMMLAGFLRRDGETLRVAYAAAASIAAWFAIDSAYGLVSGGLFNIVLVNVPAVAMTLPPWLLLARHLHRREVDGARRAASWSPR
jgi:hypothetical protein